MRIASVAVPQERLQELRTRADGLRKQCQDLETKERACAAEARQNAEAAARREAAVKSLKARHGRMTALTWLSGGATAAALGATLVLGAPILGLAALGAGVGLAFAGRETMRLNDGFHIVGFSAENRALLAQIDDLQVKTLQQQQSDLGAQIATFDAERAQLEVESLVPSPAPQFARVIEAGEDLVTIGGVTLPRRKEA